jgi:hypothetical protein
MCISMCSNSMWSKDLPLLVHSLVYLSVVPFSSRVSRSMSNVSIIESTSQTLHIIATPSESHRNYGHISAPYPWNSHSYSVNQDARHHSGPRCCFVGNPSHFSSALGSSSRYSLTLRGDICWIQQPAGYTRSLPMYSST